MIPVISGALVLGFVRHVLVGLGIGIISFVGLEAFLSTAAGDLKGSISGAGVAANFAGLLGIDRAISAILSGLSARIALSTLKKFSLL